MLQPSDLSIVIPAKNEAGGLQGLLPRLRDAYPDCELIVVNDGSTDGTADLASEHGAIVVDHPYSKGNGAAIKSGARRASRDFIVFMDADGQHRPEQIADLLQRQSEGFDMVVGARQGLSSQANIARWSANSLYNRLASWMVNCRIDDLTSGFRLVERRKFLGFLYLLPNGFSYPTTSTMAFFRAGYSVGFVPITVDKRVGTNSHVNMVRDGVRFLLIIFKIGTLYSPLKVYFPIAAVFILLGAGNYVATWLYGAARLTNMTTLMLLGGVIVFLIGLLSEQLTNLQYKDADIDHD